MQSSPGLLAIESVWPRLRKGIHLPDIFLSYSRDDQATARRFADSFEREGLSVWWDATLAPGEAFDEVTERALSEAKAVVVLWSRKSVASRWVRAEATQANEQRKMVPVMIESCKRPIMFELTHTADLSGWSGNPGDREWQSCLSAVRHFVAGVEPRPTANSAAIASRSGRGMKVSANKVLLLSALVLVGGGMTWALIRAQSPHTSNAALPAVAAPADVSLAVLPFVDLSEHHDQGYLSDGLAEELVDLFTKIPQLRVTARSSSFAFRDQSLELPAIAKKLNVANILEGSVRKSGDRLRISVQLVKASSGTTLWSETYDREIRDVFEVQESVANAVVKALSVRLLVDPNIPSTQQTQNTDAFEEYLLGRQYLDGFALARQQLAREAFERAIKLDPSFAPAHAGLALAAEAIASITGQRSWFDLASSEAELAIRLAPELTEGYVARARVRMFRDWNWAGGKADLDSAQAIDPNNAKLLQSYGSLLSVTDKLDESVALKRRTVDLDPMSSTSWDLLAEGLIANRDFKGARDALDRAQQLSPYSDFRVHIRARLELSAGNYAEALQLARQNPNASQRDYGLALAEYSVGNNTEANAALQRLIATVPDDYAAQIAMIYAWQGNKDLAFKWLDRALALHDLGLLGIKHAAFFDKLRGDPRFNEVLDRMNLSE
jgi:TolB-like protein